MKDIPLYNVRPIKNLKEMLETSASLYSDKPAFMVKKSTGGEYSPISYREFKTDVDALGTALIELGLKGKRIAVIGENRYEWVVTYLSVVNGTGVAVPLDKELPRNEIENLVERSEASAVIFSGKLSEQILGIAPKLKSPGLLINMDSMEHRNNMLSYRRILMRGLELLAKGDESFKNLEIDNEAMNILLYTSGTTSLSKAVMLSHANIASNLMAMCSYIVIGEKDTFLSVLPIHHTYECTCGILCPIYGGSTVAFCEGLRHIPRNLQESKANIMLGVPLIFETIYGRIWDQAAKKPGMLRKLKIALGVSNLLKSLGIDITTKLFKPIQDNLGGHVRLFISGAAGIDPNVAKGFRDFGIPLIQGYGLTECSPIVALNREFDLKNDAAGLPLPNLEVKISDPNSEGIGEITVKGPSVMLGYYNNEEVSSKVLKDGWFHTGDLGFIDKDKFVHITGRKKNVIVTKNGKNIYPEEIEALLNRSPYILESMVYAENEPETGDLIVSAIIVPDAEKIKELAGENVTGDFVHDLIKKEIRAVNSGLVIYKHIKDFYLRNEEFAKTTTKKIKRYVESNRTHNE